MTNPNLNTLDLWQAGKRNARRTYLFEFRATDPEQARELVASVWHESNPQARQSFIQPFNINLSMDDEPFLENALDDHSNRVRATIAYVLCRLPASRLVQRTIDQAFDHIRYCISKRPATPDRIDITLPGNLSPSMKRDGFYPKSYDKQLSNQAYWLSQMLSRIPPQVWSDRWHTSSQQIVTAAIHTVPHRYMLLTGWMDACNRNSDPDWADALLSYGLDNLPGLNPHHLLVHVPTSRREEHIQQTWTRYPRELHTPNTPTHILGTLHNPWSLPFSQFILDRIIHYANPATPSNPDLPPSIVHIANSLSPTIYPEALSRLGPPTPINPSLSTQITTLLQTLKAKYEQLTPLE